MYKKTNFNTLKPLLCLTLLAISSKACAMSGSALPPDCPKEIDPVEINTKWEKRIQNQKNLDNLENIAKEILSKKFYYNIKTATLSNNGKYLFIQTCNDNNSGELINIETNEIIKIFYNVDLVEFCKNDKFLFIKHNSTAKLINSAAELINTENGNKVELELSNIEKYHPIEAVGKFLFVSYNDETAELINMQTNKKTKFDKIDFGEFSKNGDFLLITCKNFFDQEINAFTNRYWKLIDTKTGNLIYKTPSSVISCKLKSINKSTFLFLQYRDKQNNKSVELINLETNEKLEISDAISCKLSNNGDFLFVIHRNNVGELINRKTNSLIFKSENVNYCKFSKNSELVYISHPEKYYGDHHKNNTVEIIATKNGNKFGKTINNASCSCKFINNDKFLVVKPIDSKWRTLINIETGETIRDYFFYYHEYGNNNKFLLIQEMSKKELMHIKKSKICNLAKEREGYMLLSTTGLLILQDKDKILRIFKLSEEIEPFKNNIKNARNLHTIKNRFNGFCDTQIKFWKEGCQQKNINNLQINPQMNDESNDIKMVNENRETNLMIDDPKTNEFQTFNQTKVRLKKEVKIVKTMMKNLKISNNNTQDMKLDLPDHNFTETESNFFVDGKRKRDESDSWWPPEPRGEIKSKRQKFN